MRAGSQGRALSPSGPHLGLHAPAQPRQWGLEHRALLPDCGGQHSPGTRCPPGPCAPKSPYVLSQRSRGTEGLGWLSQGARPQESQDGPPRPPVGKAHGRESMQHEQTCLGAHVCGFLRLPRHTRRLGGAAWWGQRASSEVPVWLAAPCLLSPNGRSPSRQQEDTHSQPCQATASLSASGAGRAGMPSRWQGHCRCPREAGPLLAHAAAPAPWGDRRGAELLHSPHPRYPQTRRRGSGHPAALPRGLAGPSSRDPALRLLAGGHSPHSAATQARRASILRPGLPEAPGGGCWEMLLLWGPRAARIPNNQLVFLQRVITSCSLPAFASRTQSASAGSLEARPLPPPGDPCRAQPRTTGRQALRGGGASPHLDAGS